MFKIAICSNKKLYCSQIENTLLDFKQKKCDKIDIDVFYSGEELYNTLKRYRFDLIFLDIKINLLDGIAIGHKIREEMDDYTTQIIYMSDKTNYYKEVIKVQPMDFLEKPITDEKVINDVLLGMKLLNKLGETFSYKKGFETYKINIKDIIYFESMSRKIKIVTIKGEDMFYGKISEIFNCVAKYRFMWIHKSFIVNYSYISKFNYHEITMENMTALPISQSRRRKIKELWIGFKNDVI